MYYGALSNSNAEKKVNTSLQRKKSQLVIPKLEEGDAPRQITKLLGPMFFFTPTTATRFKQFTVWKWNKFGLRKDRFLGVDAERITITGADKRSKSKTVTMPFCLILTFSANETC